MNNGALVVKKREGSKLFGVGNEPFWSVEIKKNDSMSFSLPEWNHPVTMKVAGREKKGDTLIYFATADSLRLTTTVLPYFCSDGMSDFIYSHKITVNYNGRKYNGCGVKYQ
jgi:uncharacterized membrane protein